jgi:hypothetical protein
VEGDLPAVPQIKEFIKDSAGNYTGFVLKAVGLANNALSVAVHYLVVAKDEGFETIGTQQPNTPTPQVNPPVLPLPPPPEENSSVPPTEDQNPPIDDSGSVDSEDLENSGTFTPPVESSQPTEPPQAPVNLNANAVSPTEVSLSWQDLASDEDGFAVMRSEDTINYGQIANLPANAVSYSDTNLTPETAYQYRVYSFNAAGDSSAAQVSALTPALSEPPSVPDETGSTTPETLSDTPAE